MLDTPGAVAVLAPGEPLAAGRALAAGCAAVGGPAAILVAVCPESGDPRTLVAALGAAAGAAPLLGWMTSVVAVCPSPPSALPEGERTRGGGRAVAVAGLVFGDLAAPARVSMAASLGATSPPSPHGLALILGDAGLVEGDLGGFAAALGPGWGVAGAVVAGWPLPARRFTVEEISARGVATLLLPTKGLVAVAVATGVAPLGPPGRVSAARGRVVASIDGAPAFAALAARAGFAIGDLAGIGDRVFVLADGRVRAIVAVDPERGLLATSTAIPEGAEVRFAVREPGAAAAALEAALAEAAGRLGRAPRAGLLLSCPSRGPLDVELARAERALPGVPFVAAAAAGQIAGDALHALAAVVALT